MSRYDDLVKVAQAKWQEAADREKEVQNFVVELRRGFSGGIGAPLQSLFFLPWNAQTHRFDDMLQQDVAPAKALAHDEKEASWRFNLFVSLSPEPNMAKGVLLQVAVVPHKAGYYVATGGGERRFVDLNVQSYRDALWREWAAVVEQAFVDDPVSDPAAPQVWS